MIEQQVVCIDCESHYLPPPGISPPRSYYCEDCRPSASWLGGVHYAEFLHRCGTKKTAEEAWALLNDRPECRLDKADWMVGYTHYMEAQR